MAEKPSFDARILNSLFGSAKEVLEKLIKTQATFQAPRAKSEKRTFGYASGVMGVAGSGLSGSVSVTGDKLLLTQLGEVFEIGKKPPEQFFTEVVTRLCAVVGGRYQEKLSELGIEIKLDKPRIIIGQDHMLSHGIAGPVIMLPIRLRDLVCHVEGSFAVKKATIDEDLPSAHTTGAQQKAVVGGNVDIVWEDE